MLIVTGLKRVLDYFLPTKQGRPRKSCKEDILEKMERRDSQHGDWFIIVVKASGVQDVRDGRFYRYNTYNGWMDYNVF